MWNPSDPVVLVNELNFQEEVVASPLPVLVDVSTEWCGPCKVAAPVVAELARRHAGKLKVVTIDGGESAGLVARLGVRGFPTFIGMEGGRVVRTKAGFSGKAALERFTDEILAGTSAPARALGG